MDRNPERFLSPVSEQIANTQFESKPAPLVTDDPPPDADCPKPDLIPNAGYRGTLISWAHNLYRETVLRISFLVFRTMESRSGWQYRFVAVSTMFSSGENGAEENLLLKIAEGVRSTHGHDGSVVLDIHHGQIFTLNIVGAKIIELLEQGRSETQIVESISDTFQICRDIIERDVREFLECLQKHRLVEYDRRHAES
jgi:hypothetical protein